MIESVCGRPERRWFRVRAASLYGGSNSGNQRSLCSFRRIEAAYIGWSVWQEHIASGRRTPQTQQQRMRRGELTARRVVTFRRLETSISFNTTRRIHKLGKSPSVFHPKNQFIEEEDTPNLPGKPTTLPEKGVPISAKQAIHLNLQVRELQYYTYLTSDTDITCCIDHHSCTVGVCPIRLPRCSMFLGYISMPVVELLHNCIFMNYHGAKGDKDERLKNIGNTSNQTLQSFPQS